MSPEPDLPGSEQLHPGLGQAAVTRPGCCGWGLGAQMRDPTSTEQPEQFPALPSAANPLQSWALVQYPLSASSFTSLCFNQEGVCLTHTR